jgi:hypothetical protein
VLKLRRISPGSQIAASEVLPFTRLPRSQGGARDKDVVHWILVNTAAEAVEKGSKTSGSHAIKQKILGDDRTPRLGGSVNLCVDAQSQGH